MSAPSHAESPGARRTSPRGPGKSNRNSNWSGNATRCRKPWPMRVMIDLGMAFFRRGGQSSSSSGWLYWNKIADESRDMPCTAADRSIRFWLYRFSATGTPGPSSANASASSRPNTKASSIAMHPPCPKFGIIGCAASPKSTTLPFFQDTEGGRSYRSRCSTSSSGVESRRSNTSSLQPSNSFLRNSIAGAPVRCSSGIEPGGMLRKAYHWILPPPTSTDTKYFRRPRKTL
mmetsp:Transcript_40728/g.92360  ORF Transcript_40728/g.92360 Transcript_40728/m.92360 type:complete len:231 (-) Transcript_40728:268-960(-)